MNKTETNAARFFIDKNAIRGREIEITGDDAKHIVASLRMKAGGHIAVCDKEGTDYACELTYAGAGAVRAEILRGYPSAGEPGVKVILYQSLPKSDKFDYVIQKCVEAGIYKINPVVSARTQFGGRIRDAGEKLQARWRRISYEAAKQSGRGIVPEISVCRPFPQAVDECAERVSERPLTSLAIIPYENEERVGIRGEFTDFKCRSAAAQREIHREIHIFIGPEGGYSNEEISYCVTREIKPVTLGPRVLRTETAGLAALCQAMYEFEM